MLNIPGLYALIFASPVLPLVLSLAVPFGIGALGIFFTQQFFQQVLLRANTIWALIACLLIALLIKDFVPYIPSFFVSDFSVEIMMMVAVGAFTAGKRYWF